MAFNLKKQAVEKVAGSRGSTVHGLFTVDRYPDTKDSAKTCCAIKFTGARTGCSPDAILTLLAIVAATGNDIGTTLAADLENALRDCRPEAFENDSPATVAAPASVAAHAPTAAETLAALQE